jgi:hypothetical protein
MDEGDVQGQNPKFRITTDLHLINTLALLLPLHRNPQLMYKRLRRLSYGCNQRLQAIPQLLRLRPQRRNTSHRHRIRYLHNRQLSRILRRRPSNRFSRKEMGHVHWNQYHHGRGVCTSNVYQSRRVHGRSLRSGFRRRNHIDCWTSVCQRDGTSSLSRRVYRCIQHILVRRRYPG